MALGNFAVVNASNKVRIGDGNITVIEGQVDWSFPSDGRFKTNVKTNVAGLDFIMKLRPVTYTFDMATYNRHIRPDDWQTHLSPENDKLEKAHIEANKDKLHSGFIAQEVEKAAYSIGFDFNGIVRPQSEKDNYGLRYGTFVVPLVQATQEQERKIQMLTRIVEKQEAKIAQLETSESDIKAELDEIKVMLEHILQSQINDSISYTEDQE